jgi:hypothetical protein
VLVAIDGSSASRLALAAGVIVARRDRAILTVMTVVRDVAADAARWSGALMVPADSQDAVDDGTSAIELCGSVLRTRVAGRCGLVQLS